MDRDVVGWAHGVVAPVRTDAAGLAGPRRREAAGPEWRRSSRGFYVPSYVERTPAQRVVEAGVLVPRFSAVTGWGSLSWHGGRWFTGTLPDGSPRDVVIVSPGNGVVAQSGVTVCGERFRPFEIVQADGIAVASAPSALCFEMRYASSVRSARVALAMAAYDDLVSVDELDQFAYERASWTGIEQCRDGSVGVDENVWSPQEQWMTEAWDVAGFGRPLANRPLFDLRGNHIGTPDLIDARRGVIGQYDGVLHLAGPQRAKDLQRDETFTDHGLETVVAVAGELGTARWEQRLRRAYARAERRPVADRTWTLELPPWWVPTFTVAQRRALTEEQRDRWLRYRAA